MTLELKKTTDILKHLGTIKRPDQLLVGFALETENELENAKKKLIKKNLDLIVLNSTRDKGQVSDMTPIKLPSSKPPETTKPILLRLKIR